MPLPQAANVHVDTFLTGLSIGFLQEPSHFVADAVAPQVKSAKQSDKIAIYSRADMYRDEMTRRAPGSESAGGGYRVSNDNYFCDVWATHIDVDDQTVAAADMPYAPAEDAVRVVVQREKIKREVVLGSDLFTTSLWTGGTSADPTAASLSAAWDDPSSTPIEDIHDQVNSVLVKTGVICNILVLNNLGWFSLKNHPDVVDRVKYTSGDVVSEDVVARLLGLDRLVVSRAVRNTAQEGLAASYASILGNNALLVYAAPAPGLFQPSGAYTFVWTGYPGTTDGRRIKRFRIEALASERIELEACFNMKLVDANLGCYIQTVAS